MWIVLSNQALGRLLSLQITIGRETIGIQSDYWIFHEQEINTETTGSLFEFDCFIIKMRVWLVLCLSPVSNALQVYC